jgi:hypothetical protein
MSGGNRSEDHRKLAAGIACGGILLAGLAAGSHWHRAAKTGVISPLVTPLAARAAVAPPSSVLASDPLVTSQLAQQPVGISHPAKRTPAPKSSASKLPSAPTSSPTISPESRARAMKTYAALPMMFEANSGQTDPRVKFLSRAPGYTLFLTDKEAVLSLPSSSLGAAPSHAGQLSRKSPGPHLELPEAPKLTRTVRLKFAGSSTPTVVTGRDQLPGRTNYFLGNDPKQWRKNVANYEGVEYRGVYPGVDVVFHGNQQHLEYDFIVAPGADPHVIALDVEGAKRMHITPRGDMVLGVGQSELELEKPIVYQEVKGQRREVAGNFVLRGPHRISFVLGPYDHSQPLVIDPTLAYSTYLGKVYLDSVVPAFVSVAADSNGNAYIAGTTLYSSPSFLTSPSQTCPGGCTNPVAFVMKIDPNASGSSSLLYSTYLGPPDSQSGYDTRANAIAVDGNGNAYVAGQTNAYNFPVANGPTVPACGFQTLGAGNPPTGSNYCGFVAEVSGSAASGPELVYSTYIGGPGAGNEPTANNVATGIAVDSSGDAYVAGYTTSANLLTSVASNNGQPLPSGFQTTLQGTQNAFVAELQTGATGPYFSYLSYLGGSVTDMAKGIAVSPNGEAFVVGSTTSPNFPAVNAYQSSLLGPNVLPVLNSNAFFSAVVPGGGRLVYSTYLGGTGADSASAVAADSYNNAYITGNLGLTQNLNYQFPVTVNTACSASPVCPLMFVAKLDPSMTGNASLVYSSYLGGNSPSAAGIESAQGIAVDGQGDAFVTGWEHSAKDTNFPLMGVSVSSSAVQQTDPCVPLVPPVSATYINECSAGFLVEFLPDASISYSTFLGVSASVTAGATFPNNFPIVQGTGIALDSQGDAYIAGVAGGYTPLIETTSATATSTAAFMPNPTDEYTGTYDRNGFLSVISALAKPPLTISPAALAAGTAGVLYSPVTFTATGGQGTVTISESGNLPSGMTFSNGTLAGTPTQTGSYPITITATDSQSDTGSENLTMVINCPTITVGPSTLANGMVGTAYPAVTFTATGGVGAITFSETGLPAGIGMSFAGAVLSGTPTTAESFSMMVTATDSNGCSGSVTDTLTINSVTIPPALVTDNETITVTDTPTFPDVPDSETITVTDGVTVTPLISITAPVASFSTSGLGFGTVAAGSTGTQIITVSNVGEGQTGLLLSGAVISPSGTPFSMGAISCSNGASSFSTTLPSGGACLVTISYAAPASGTPPSATITFTDNAALSNLTSTLTGSSYTQTISLNGTGTTAPQPTEPSATVPVSDNETITVTDTPTFPDVADSETITVTDQVSITVSPLSPLTLSFADQLVGSTSATQTVTLTNAGTAKLTVGTITTTADYTHPSKTCTATLAAGSSCTISVAFAPKSTGPLTGTLTVGTNGTVALSGTGIAPAASISPATYVFANQQVDTTSTTQAFAYSNTGQVSITVSSVTLSGTAAANYAIASDPCTGVTLVPGATCDVGVTFTPSAAKNRVATLTVTDETGGAAPAAASLSGTGVAATASLTGAAAFGNQQVGVTSATQTLTYQNTGIGPISVNSAALSGNAATDYVIATDACTGATLATSATCSVGVTFTPSAVGSRVASLTVTDSTGGAKAQILSLSGTGIAPTISLGSGTYAYGAVTAATPATFTLTNSGTASLVISTIALTGTQFTVTEGGTCTVAGSVSSGGFCTVIVTFTPSGTTKFTGTLTVSGTGVGTGSPTYTASRTLTGH